MILFMIPSLIFVISGDIGKKSDLFTFIPGDEVTINIHAKEKSKSPVSRYLYGKFTEHLGRNIYNGMWAQILQNPGFEGWHFWGSNYEDMSLRMRHFAERLGMTDVMDSYNRGIAPWWLLYGRGQVNYELDEESFNSQLAQKITAKSLESPQVGLRQVVFLPTHRERNYNFSLYARSEKPCRLYVGIRKAKDMDDLMAENHIDIGNKDWQRYDIELSINKAVDKGEILLFTLGLSEPCTVWLDQMALFPQDNLRGFDPDVVKFTKESGLPILRYPGGNFVSGYHWKDGIGPIDKRESTANKPWNMIEYNHVGTDEFVDFCRLTGAEPMICVNAGDGTPEEAAEWLEYCNGNTSTKYGKLRAENGHPEPYNIVYWEIGNELYGNWQIGHCSPEEYAERYEKFYKAMVAVDSKIKIIANGQDMRWNAPIIKRKWDILRSLSIHTLIGGGTPENADPNEVFESLMAYTTFYERHLGDLEKQMAEKIKEPKFAVTELQVFTNRPGLPNNASLTESLFWSGIVNTCIRLEGLVEMVTHSALVNHGGGLRKEREIVYANPIYYAQKLYSIQSGIIPVKIEIQCPVYKSSGRYSPVDSNVPYIDAIALMDENNTELNLIITNRHPHKDMEGDIILHDFVPSENAKLCLHTGESFMARNEWDRPEEVSLRNSIIRIDGDNLKYSIPKHSIALITFTRKFE